MHMPRKDNRGTHSSRIRSCSGRGRHGGDGRDYGVRAQTHSSFFRFLPKHLTRKDQDDDA